MQDANVSNVARLKAELELTSAAARYGLYGPAIVARHPFITKKMERMGELHDELAEKIGERRADKFLIRAMEGMAQDRP